MISHPFPLNFLFMDDAKVDNILQYALLVASREDDLFDRELGPIHLIKYVYLADLAYAEEHDGQTFTGVNWQFYKFGPWANAVYQRIEPSLTEIGAAKKILPSDFDDRDEWVRWRALDDKPEKLLERELPIIVTSSIRRNVHQFGKDTPELLAYVYSTPPMRAAAPNEYLDFSHLREIIRNSTQPEQHIERKSKKKKKMFKKKMDDLKVLAAKKLAAKRRRTLVSPIVKPRFDDVYFEGLAWLDSLAGKKIAEGEKEAVFSDSIWKSSARRDENVPD